LSTIDFDKSWTLFLDRDGVINEKLENDYVKTWDEFTFKYGVLEAIARLGRIFGRIFVVTNQRGVGFGLMTEEKLNEIHARMCFEVARAHGKIDRVYYCTEIDERSECRKPNIGMGLRARSDFPEIEFSKSILVGDSISDLEFGKNLGMKTIFIGSPKETIELDGLVIFESLHDFSKSLI
jgi:histidinol-phosphate phosphatase family protein